MKILLAENEEIQRKCLGFYFLRFFQKNFPDQEIVVREAGNGYEALEIFKNEKEITVVITDCLMPFIDGIELAKAIRKIDRNVPIVLMSRNNIKVKLFDNIEGVNFLPKWKLVSAFEALFEIKLKNKLTNDKNKESVI